jgi:hypothetical protein
MLRNVSVENQQNADRTSSNQVVRQMLMMGIVLAMICQTGCANRIGRFGVVDEIAISYRDAVWGKRAYNLRYANCDRPYGDHFEAGFCSGYGDICNGGDGYIPALPPDDYRGYEFQSTDGAQCVASWFEGYPAGVKAAQEDRAGTYHDVYISRMIDSAVTQGKAKHALPADVPVSNRYGQASPPVPPRSTGAYRAKTTSVNQPMPAMVKSPALPTQAPMSVFKLSPVPQVQASPLPKYTPTSTASAVPAPPAMKSVLPPLPGPSSVDPTAGVTRDETPLPMAVRSAAAWESNRRQAK